LKSGLAVTDEPLVIIGGPTAVGKSQLALALATRLSGELVNLDSVQIYRDFIIGSAQPSVEEQQIVPHHLFGVLDPHDKISVGKYLKLFAPIEQAIRARHKLPLLVGGTSLYLTGVLYGLADLPEDEALRETIESLTTEALYEALVAAVGHEQFASLQIHPHDRVRLSRALEVVRLGKDIAMTRINHQATPPRRALVIVPMLPRDVLYKRIDARVERMIAQGLCDEVQMLLRVYGADLPALRSIGYKETVSFLQRQEGGSLSGLTDQIAQQTRRFAKRQMTWLRNEPLKRGWNVHPPQIESPKDNRTAASFATLRYTMEELVAAVQQYLATPALSDQFPVTIWFVSV
jgi:tRNA dimethylallyltransferase